VSELDWKGLREAAGDDGISRVPDGWYDCVVKSTKVGQTSAGYKKINARLVVESGPYAGTSLFKDFTVTTDKPGGLKFFFRHMAVLGVTAEQFTPDLTMAALAQRLLERRAQVQVGTGIWKDQERMEVKDLKALPGSPGSAYSGPPVSTTPLPAPSVPAMPVPVQGGALVEPSLPAAPAVPQAPMFDENDFPPEPPF
jgi:hypothetical protein